MPRILIADDERENRDALVRALQDENPGWEIFAVDGFANARRVLEDNFEARAPIDVVLTDLVMEEEGSGLHLLSEAQKIDPGIIIIIFTAKEMALDRYAALRLGAFDVIEKNLIGRDIRQEINIKTRTALAFGESKRRLQFLRRYFDPRMFDSIDQESSALELGRRLVTICFWDIRGFTRLCEVLMAYPDLIAGFLREYCDVSARIIFKHRGLLDKFIGDGVMALFGVLNHKDDDGAEDAVDAVRAAIELRAEFDLILTKWSEKWARYTPQKIEIGLGCGIHTGDVLVGNVGTEFRDQFTALGSPVNFASRIQGEAGSGEILISQSTAVRVKSAVSLQPFKSIASVKNMPGTFDIFRV